MTMTTTMSKVEPQIVFEVVVHGCAQPAGSKRSVVRRGRGGKIIMKSDGSGPVIGTIDANPNSAEWKRTVAQVCGKEWGGKELLTGPLYLEVVFHRTRAKNDFGSGRNASVLKGSARAFPTSAPDSTKLVRGIEDAMIGVIYRDDAQIVRQCVDKVYSSTARVEIRIGALPATVSDYNDALTLAARRTT